MIFLLLLLHNNSIITVQDKWNLLRILGINFWYQPVVLQEVCEPTDFKEIAAAESHNF